MSDLSGQGKNLNGIDGTPQDVDGFPNGEAFPVIPNENIYKLIPSEIIPKNGIDYVNPYLKISSTKDVQRGPIINDNVFGYPENKIIIKSDEMPTNPPYMSVEETGYWLERFERALQPPEA